MTSGDLRDTRFGRIGPSQRPASLVQSLQQKISRGAYTEEFGATHTQRSRRRPEFCTKRGHAEFLVSAFA